MTMTTLTGVRPRTLPQTRPATEALRTEHAPREPPKLRARNTNLPGSADTFEEAKTPVQRWAGMPEEVREKLKALEALMEPYRPRHENARKPLPPPPEIGE